MGTSFSSSSSSISPSCPQLTPSTTGSSTCWLSAPFDLCTSSSGEILTSVRSSSRLFSVSPSDSIPPLPSASGGFWDLRRMLLCRSRPRLLPHLQHFLANLLNVFMMEMADRRPRSARRRIVRGIPILEYTMQRKVPTNVWGTRWPYPAKDHKNINTYYRTVERLCNYFQNYLIKFLTLL